jgi:hypothetical protein
MLLRGQEHRPLDPLGLIENYDCRLVQLRSGIRDSQETLRVFSKIIASAS